LKRANLRRKWSTIPNQQHFTISRHASPCGRHFAIDSQGRTIWIVDAHRDDSRRFIVRADEILTAFVELERQVLTVTFYLESIKLET
jgi:hypothetical protein